MAQILDPLPSDQSNSILCCYVNATNQIQIARITNIANWYFERVVFPGQRLVFESLPEAHLEIHTGMMASAILSDNIPCEQLAIGEGSSSSSQSASIKADPEKEENDRKPLLEANHNRTQNNAAFKVASVY